MSQIPVSKRFQKIIDKCTSGGGDKSCVFVPTVVLHNADDEYSLTVDLVTRFWIRQNFMEKYTDVMFIELEIPYAQYQEYAKHVNNLRCTIKLEYYNTKTQSRIFDIDRDDIIFKDLVVIANEENLNQRYSAGMMGTSSSGGPADTPAKRQARIKVPLYLMESCVFRTRHTQVNGIMNGVTVEQMMRWVVSQLSIEKVNIAPPDNKQVYSNFIVPPSSDIKNIFPYIQNKCGVYYDGIGWYVTGDTCYIYPQFATSTKRTAVRGTIHIAHCPDGEYKGFSCYHVEDGEDTYILSNTTLERTSLNTKSMDKTGTVHLVGVADGRHDDSVVIGKDGSVKRHASNIQTIDSVANNQPLGDAQVARFDGYSNNVYEATSQMSASNGVVMKLGWNMAILQRIKPGQEVLFHYDDKDSTYTVKRGRVMSADFDSQLAKLADGTHFGMQFICTLSLFLEPDTITNDADTTMGG